MDNVNATSVRTSKAIYDRSGRIRGAMVTVGLISSLVAGGISVHQATPADAWPTSGTVTLQGTSICAGRGTTWVWVSANNGESGWATNGTGRYSFKFSRIGSGGNTVTVNYGNSTFKCTDTFGVQRPAVGSSATRNLYRLIPNG